MSVRVVDNASGDGTAEIVAHEFPEVSLTASAANLGFAAASNIGIRAGARAVRARASTRTPGSPREPSTACSTLMEERTELGISGCRLVLRDGTLRPRSPALVPDARSARSATSPGSAASASPGALAAYRAPEVDSGPVDAVNGAFMLIRRAALDEVGLFDEGYWMYMEDLDLCYRFAEAGWVTWYEPSATVVHVKAGIERARSLAEAELRLPLRHVPLLSEALRRHEGCACERDRLRRYRREAPGIRGPKRDQASNPGPAGRAAPSGGAAGMSRWRHRPGRPGASPNL